MIFISKEKTESNNKYQKPKAYFVKSPNPQYTYNEILEMLVVNAINYINEHPNEQT